MYYYRFFQFDLKLILTLRLFCGWKQVDGISCNSFYYDFINQGAASTVHTHRLWNTRVLCISRQSSVSICFQRSFCLSVILLDIRNDWKNFQWFFLQLVFSCKPIWFFSFIRSICLKEPDVHYWLVFSKGSCLRLTPVAGLKCRQKTRLIVSEVSCSE